MENNDSNFKLLVAKAKLGELKGQKMLIEQAMNFLNKTDNSSKEKITPLKDSDTQKDINKTNESNKKIVETNSNTLLKSTLFPNTLEERQRVHLGLCSYVFNDDGHKGLTGFLKKITKNDDLQKILRWLDIYSTVEIENQVNGSYLFRKKKNSDTFSPRIGREKPYYEMDVMSKAEKFKAFTLFPPSTKSATQKSNNDFQKKVIKSCLNDFLTSPSIENQKRLNNLIDVYIDITSMRGGKATVSGGLPGLGKRR